LPLNTNTVVNASEATGAVTVDATNAGANGLAITGTTSSAVNTLTGSAQVDTITGGAGNDILSGLAGNDTINGGGGNDIITGGTGADRINVGAGTDTIVNGTGDSGTFAAPATNTLSTVAFDIITGMAAGDLIDLTDVARTVTSVNTLVGSGAADNTAVFVRGTYDAAAQTFVGSATGADSLFNYDTNITGGAVALEAIVLVGFVNTLTGNASAAGVFTLA
jgi:Ca2+-binding RTX toxin-like protein